VRPDEAFSLTIALIFLLLMNRVFNILNIMSIRKNQDVLPNLGNLIKKERARQKISLDVLAKTSGVSKGMLSQIEQSKTNPTVAVLYKIAIGLRVEPAELLPQPKLTPRTWRIIRAHDEQYTFVKNKDCLIRTLSPLDLEKQIEFYEINFGPKGKLVSEPHYQGTEEILTVAEGTLRVQSGKNETEVQKGDSIHYAADVGHAIHNLNPQSARAFLLVRYRS
jgi:transcriptional regulator with XRE-family HTH domain